jgi:glucuronate isomerase
MIDSSHASAHLPIIPSFHHSIIPSFHHSIIPPLSGLAFLFYHYSVSYFLAVPYSLSQPEIDSMPFIHDDFLLQTRTARRLYHEVASHEPILDYHCHLRPEDIASNRQFENLFEIWLEGDHYKWRAMRTAGVEEALCTGTGDPYDKFLAWARTVPQTVRNPLYHWTHLELKRYFGIDTLLDQESAPAIWQQTREQLTGGEMRAHDILKKFDVRALCTTDDPTDDLAQHRMIAASDLATRVYPTFRPDRALAVDASEQFNQWLDRLAAVSAMEIGCLDDLFIALRQRHDAFHEIGCRLSDHGLPHCYNDPCSHQEATAIFARARRGESATPPEQHQFAAMMMLFFGQLDAEKGWTKQLHLGAMRNNNSRLFRDLGPDIGCDSIGDWPQGARLASYLDRLDQEDKLPKTILYNLNPVDNYLFASMIGNFQSEGTAGKIQWGSGWWFLDQWEAIEWQLNALSNLGLLSTFVGMLTDSRSFMSYPRHEYFRRVLCNLVGADIERGAIPDEEGLVNPMIANICYRNARDYLDLSLNAE